LKVNGASTDSKLRRGVAARQLTHALAVEQSHQVLGTVEHTKDLDPVVKRLIKN